LTYPGSASSPSPRPSSRHQCRPRRRPRDVLPLGLQQFADVAVRLGVLRVKSLASGRPPPRHRYHATRPQADRRAWSALRRTPGPPRCPHVKPSRHRRRPPRRPCCNRLPIGAPRVRRDGRMAGRLRGVNVLPLVLKRGRGHSAVSALFPIGSLRKRRHRCTVGRFCASQRFPGCSPLVPRPQCCAADARRRGGGEVVLRWVAHIYSAWVS